MRRILVIGSVPDDAQIDQFNLLCAMLGAAIIDSGHYVLNGGSSKPLDVDQVTVPRGEVVIIADRCKGCAFCVEYCPKDVLRMSEAFNRKGYHTPEVIHTAECVCCNLCEMICPDFAFFSMPSDAPPDVVAKEKASHGAKEATVES